ncbi:MAG: protein-L-isoaspartate O-methyltransferase family protein, partial [Archangium sp.]
MNRLETCRRAYAKEVGATAGLEAGPLMEALASVPRERFLGPGPWKVFAFLEDGLGYRSTPDADPAHVYHDVVVALDADRLLNNGQPSGLCRWLDALALKPGERAVHVGCGTGYYSAVMAELVGPAGHVLAVEVDEGLAAKARENLSPWPQVSVLCGDGSETRGERDAIFVNAGATHPLPAWLEALAPGGRLMLPLTV